jgi:Animal haem peroxidase
MAHTQGGHRGQDIDNDFGRFGRMFPGLRGPTFDEDLLADLARSMVKDDAGKDFGVGDGDENPDLPSAYTYFGQFVDHDITLDLTGLGEQEADPSAVENFRSARLDLDCVYGHGLGSSRFLYDADAMTFRISASNIAPTKPGKVQTKFDLFRSPVGTALIGDHRNDENTIVAQIQQAFISCHNKIMTSTNIMDASVTGYERFRKTVVTVRHHYQWIVLKDYLARICDPDIYGAMVPTQMGSKPRVRHYDATGATYPYIPVEFAGAAYRFGHSMVRPSYALNSEAGTKPELPQDPRKERTRIPIFDMVTGKEDLRGFKPINPARGIDWGYFLDLPGTPPTGVAAGTKLTQPAYRMDSLLVDPLADLPDHQGQSVKRRRSLPFLNLLRGSMMQLPTAEQVAGELAMPTGGLGAFPLLSPKDIWSYGSKHMDPSKITEPDDKKLVKDLIAKRKTLGTKFAGHTPLWYYVLREAEFNSVTDKNDMFGGTRLGPMGSILLLETFLGLLWEDADSIMHHVGWRPHPEIMGAANVEKFGLKEFIRYALT